MKLPVSRITLRIYLVGLVQAALAVGVMIAIVIYTVKAHPEMDEVAVLRYVAEESVRALDDPADSGRRLEVVASGLHAGIRVVDENGVALVSRAGPVSSCWDVAPRAELTQGMTDRTCVSRCVVRASGQVVFVDTVRSHIVLTLPQIGAMFAVIFAVGSLLLGRSFVKPLQHMSTVARAFGRGDAAARVRIRRRDELGDVARAFDEMADRLTEARRAERELLANVSHELRTPLTRIRLALELGAHGNAEMAFQSQKDIAEDLDELEILIRDILTAARMEVDDGGQLQGLAQLRKESVDVHELIERASARFRTGHPGRPLHVETCPGSCVLDVDVVQLRRAIDNLLENAHKYTPDATREVQLHLETAARSVKISVVDRGIGISAEDQRQLFKPFFRAERSRSRTTGGLGLGLLLVRRIVEAHGGTVTVQSELGRGTEVTIDLPRRA